MMTLGIKYTQYQLLNVNLEQIIINAYQIPNTN